MISDVRLIKSCRRNVEVYSSQQALRLTLVLEQNRGSLLVFAHHYFSSSFFHASGIFVLLPPIHSPDLCWFLLDRIHSLLLESKSAKLRTLLAFLLERVKAEGQKKTEQKYQVTGRKTMERVGVTQDYLWMVGSF